MRFVTDNRVVDLGVNKRKMEVIAAGLPRSATSSLQAALESPYLDCYPSMHMAHVIPRPEIARLVIQAMNEPSTPKRHKILLEIFDGCAATCDFPGIAFIPDLLDLYPSAKIILNQRSTPSQWRSSIRSALLFFSSWPFFLATCLFPQDRLRSKMQVEIHHHFRRVLDLKTEFSRRDFDQGEKFLGEWYDRYHDWVREECGKRGREVLEWKPEELEKKEEDGAWGPLCRFLGKEVPRDEGGKVLPFPRVNDREQMRKVRIFLMVRGFLAWGLLLGCVYAVWRLGVGWVVPVIMGE